MNTIYDDPRDPRTYAPVEGCRCPICLWLRQRATLPPRLVRPDDPEWETLLRLSARVLP
jgi:hypothetical protein